LGKTVYYFSDKGFIPVPSMAVFLSNGGDLKKVVPTSKTEIKLMKGRILPLCRLMMPGWVDSLGKAGSVYFLFGACIISKSALILKK